MRKSANEYKFFFPPKKRCFLLRIWDWIEEEAFYPCLFTGAFLFGSLAMFLACKFI